jgi:hypothetical protein
MTKNLNLTQFALRPGQAPVVERRHQSEAVKRAAERKRKHFARVPLWWIETLTTGHCGATATMVALYLLYLDWKRGKKSFPLSNGAIPGITRWQKGRALAKLEAMGLITVEHRTGRPPLITVLQ